MEPFLANGVEDDVVSDYKLVRSCLLKFGGAYVPDFFKCETQSRKHMEALVYYCILHVGIKNPRFSLCFYEFIELVSEVDA